MSFKDKIEPESKSSETERSLEFDDALVDFRQSIHAWSAAEFSLPRIAVERSGRRIWRLAAGWALGCLLMAGSVGGGLAYRHRAIEVETARARAAEHGRQVAQEQAQEKDRQARQAQLLDGVDGELAKVDSAISREIPSAMEPLAQMMTEGENQ